MIDFMSLVRIAVNALLRNKSRSLLTTFGITIGVAAVILLVSIGNGLEATIVSEFQGIGSNLLYVVPVNVFDEEGRPSGFGRPGFGNKTFTERDIRDIKRLSPAITAAIPMTEKRLLTRSPHKQRSAPTMGTVTEYQSLNSVTLQEGRFFNQGEEERSKRVVVLGPKFANDVFPTGNAVGKTLSISSVPFKVIGITDPRGAEGNIGAASLDDHIYVPFSSLQKLVETSGVDTISVQVSDASLIEQVSTDIEKHFARRRKPDSFSVIDQRQILGTLQSVLGATTFALSGIAAISLVVGGIGVMNMMLVSVTERTREIGLRKAVGATPRVILIQFLMEAVILTMIGGVFGTVVGAGGSLIVNRFFPTSISPLSIALAIGVSTAIGIIFGILPARRAAKLSPIEALRYE